MEYLNQQVESRARTRKDGCWKKDLKWMNPSSHWWNGPWLVSLSFGVEVDRYSDQVVRWQIKRNSILNDPVKTKETILKHEWGKDIVIFQSEYKDRLNVSLYHELNYGLSTLRMKKNPTLSVLHHTDDATQRSRLFSLYPIDKKKRGGGRWKNDEVEKKSLFL